MRNTIIISPRRYGKSSLVKEAFSRFIKTNSGEYIFCFIDFFKALDLNELVNIYTSSIINATSTKFEVAVKNVKEFLTNIIPKISIGTDPANTISLSIDRKDTESSLLDLLELPEKIATKNNKKIIICIDEFQNVATYDNNASLQKKLRAVWQNHTNVAYILFGSKNHMMFELFDNASKPFYRFGDIIFLDTINKKDFSEFIHGNFAKTKKDIANHFIDRILEFTRLHPYYTQQLCDILWNRTDDKVTEEVLERSFEYIINQNVPFFEQIIDGLTVSQINFIKAILKGEQEYSSNRVISEYGLNSSSNVHKIISALQKKDIIIKKTDRIFISDPIIEYCFKKYMSITS